MAAELGMLPVALTSKLKIWFPQLGKRGGGRSSDKITSHDFLLICSVAGNSAHRFVASQGMEMVDQWRVALPGDWITGSGTR